jgi:YVTN family beta-propeller protein
MANTTGVTAVADRLTDTVWLSTLSSPRIATTSDLLPANRAAAGLHRAVRPATGVLSGLPGAVTDMAVSRDGRHLVAVHYGEDAVSVIDIATLTVSSTVSGIAEPYAVATADRAYVNSASDSEDSVVAIDLGAGAALAAKEITVGARGLAVSPAGDALYVARSGDDVADIAVIDVESGKSKTITVTRTVDDWVDTVRINADGTRLYAALNTDTGGSLVVIDVRARRVLHTIALGGSIGDIAVDSDNRKVLVTGWDDERGGVVRVVDAVAGRVSDTIAVHGLPVQMAVRGAAAYLAVGHEVVIIDTATARIADRIDAGGPVSCIAVSRDGTRLFVADYDGAITALEVAKTGLELRAAS